MSIAFTPAALARPKRSKSLPYEPDVPRGVEVLPKKLHWWQGWFRATWLYLWHDRDPFILRGICTLFYMAFNVDIIAMIGEAPFNFIPGGQVVDLAYFPEAPSALLLGLIALRLLKARKKVAYYRQYWD